jgi:hypothetical protein
VPSHSCLEVTTPVDDKEEMLDYEPSSVREDMDVNVIYLSFVDYSLVGDDEVAEMSFGPRETMFQKPKDVENHLKLLYIRGHLDGMPISRMPIDGGAMINMMLYSFFKKMGKSDEELIKTNMTINSVGGGGPIGAKGITFMEVTMGAGLWLPHSSSSRCKVTRASSWDEIGFMTTISYLLPCINS